MKIDRTVIAHDTTPAELIETHCADILTAPGMQREACCMQHGTTSVLAHSAMVCAWSLAVARELRIPVDAAALTRASLLHDYFLYDWHVPGPENHVHGFTHPFIAARNARQHFDIGSHERHIIRTHMFPLVPLPPLTREAWIVCLVDTACALTETLRR